MATGLPTEEAVDRQLWREQTIAYTRRLEQELGTEQLWREHVSAYTKRLEQEIAEENRKNRIQLKLATATAWIAGTTIFIAGAATLTAAVAILRYFGHAP